MNRILVFLSVIATVVFMGHLARLVLKKKNSEVINFFTEIKLFVFSEVIALIVSVGFITYFGHPLDEEVSVATSPDGNPRSRSARRDQEIAVDACVKLLREKYSCLTFGEVAVQGEWQRTLTLNTAEDTALSDYWMKSFSGKLKGTNLEAFCQDEETSMRVGCQKHPNAVIKY